MVQLPRQISIKIVEMLFNSAENVIPKLKVKQAFWLFAQWKNLQNEFRSQTKMMSIEEPRTRTQFKLWKILEWLKIMKRLQMDQWRRSSKIIEAMQWHSEYNVKPKIIPYWNERTLPKMPQLAVWSHPQNYSSNAIDDATTVLCSIQTICEESTKIPKDSIKQTTVRFERRALHSLTKESQSGDERMYNLSK